MTTPTLKPSLPDGRTWRITLNAEGAINLQTLIQAARNNPGFVHSGVFVAQSGSDLRLEIAVEREDTE